MKPMFALATLFAVALPAALAAAPAGDRGRDGEVRAVSVRAATGNVEVVIDLQGAVEVQDFTLNGPARLVLDLVGARLAAPATLYDGENRGGIRNIRYAQFKPDVVRVVIDLDVLKGYQVQRGAGQVRVRIVTERTGFASWSSLSAANVAVDPAPSAAPMPTSPPEVTGGPDQAARVRTPTVGRPMSIDEYLARHNSEAQQSPAPRITVQWDAASIEDVVAGFAAFSGRTIVIGKGITGTVSAEIKNQPWDLAFHAVLESQGLDVVTLPGGIFNVVSKAELARADSTVPIETRLVRINYAKATSLVPAVSSIVTKRGAVVADSTSNSLVITEVSSRINAVADFVRGLDLRTPQVSIQAKIIFVDRTDVEELGVKYDLGSTTQFFNRLIQRPDPRTAQPVDTDLDGVPDALVPTENFNQGTNIVALGGNSLSAIGNASQAVINPAIELIFSTAIGNFDLTTFVQALQRVELADIQAEPTITTVDNRQAEILVGDRVPIRIIDVSAQAGQGGGAASNVPRATVQFQQTGINLRVTPHVTQNRQILMEVHAERSNVRPAAVDIGFTFQTQQADNQILVNDGETAVIGGLTVTEVTVTKSGIPFLVDLPILGKLFGFSSQQEVRRDLLILITPHIIDDLVAPTGQ
ncbi:MAG TPA: AMIN domain-containing protein [Gemmatimonadales bacterium]|jgi:type IV pilus assembly protein PilQ|nr:AMIN domain-containing protein [Gemmatimonadales bacterium]